MENNVRQKYNVNTVSYTHLDVYKRQDRDMAERVAKKYSANHVLDYVALNDDYSIYEINPPEGWVGKSIRENNVRQKYNVNIVTVKEAGMNRVLPLPDYVFKADDAVMVLGLNADVDKLVRKL